IRGFANAKSHLDRAYEGCGDSDGRGCHRVWGDRPGAPGERREMGYSQSRALRRLRSIQIRDSRRHNWGYVRSLSGPDGGDAAISADLPASHRKYSRRTNTGESGEGAEAAAW